MVNSLHIGYVLNTYPQPSVTFIRREIQALERQGVRVHRFAMRSDRSALVDAGDLAEYERTELVLKAGAGRLLADLAHMALTRPRRFGRALRLALRMGARLPRGRLRHLIYLAEAAHVTRRAQALGLRHLHAHFGTNAAAVVALARRLGGPGYSMTVHGPEEFDRPDALSLGDKIAGSEFTVGISSHGRSQLSRWAAHEDWHRLQVVHCGIEPARFPDPVPMPETDLHLVNIGRFAEQKGQLLLPEAVAMARRQGARLRLTLVGDGPMRPAIEAAITQYGLDDAITLTGWLDEAGVRDVLNRAHALVLPSFAEGLPMVVMEAMAAGRAVIGTWIAGNPELIVPGRTGWLVPAGDVAALADAMAQAAALPLADLQRMGQAGRDRVLKRHDIDDQAARLAELFRKAAG